MKFNTHPPAVGHPIKSRRFALKKSIIAMSGVLLATTGALNALAQDSSAEEKRQAKIQLEEIIVTGSLIRGIEPAGKQSIALESEAIQISGAKTANEVLGSLPQANNLFHSSAALNPRAQSRISITRPNLRGLPGFDQASGAATLVLVDGHRVVGMGVAQSAPDPDIVPPSVIERVEIITDGGSSLYGADAVGGVVNIITKQDYDGVQVDVGYNTADDYWGYDTNITGGTSWEGGSGYLSLSYADRDSLLGKDRDWAAGGTWTNDGLVPSGTQCDSPVGTTQTMQFRELIPGVRVWDGRAFPVVAQGQTCDTGQLGTLYPKEDRSNLFFGVSQTLSEGFDLDVKGYYSDRTTIFESYPLGSSVSFGPSQFSPTPAATVGELRERGSLGFSYAPHASYHHRDGDTTLETYGITPELTVDLPHGWQLRNMLHYSRSDNAFVSPGVNNQALLNAIAAGTVVPSNIAAANPAAITNILDWELAGEAVQELYTARVAADGVIMTLPAGEVHMAAGVEFSEQRNKLRQGDTVIGGLSDVNFRNASRDVKSVFTEIQIPLLADLPAVDSLTLSASVRYDDYSDFGDTANPSLGLTWKPVDWVSLRGNWGESFVAPTLTDELNAIASLAVNANAVGIVRPSAERVGVAIEPGRTSVAALNGAQPDLLPQTADTWAVGFEISPPVAEGLRLSANYYEIDFFDLLGGINPQLVTAAQLFPDRYIFNPTQADLDAAGAISVNGANALFGVNPSTVAAIIDLRVGNTNEAALKGIDFGINYEHDTEIGAFSYGLSGTRRTEFELTQGGVTGDELEFGQPETLAMASIGWQSGNWRSNLSLKYTQGFDVDDARLGQTKVDAFKTVDLFVGYDFQATGLLQDLSLRFNVSNLFDEEPPLYRLNDQPSYRGFTLGRMFGVGLTKSFN